MNINIVSPWSIRHDHILRRMTDYLPWPVAETPRCDALNYFVPYHFYADTDGPTATLFSHDVGNGQWARAAERTDLRLAWTPLYTEPLSEHGPTRRVIPGLDQSAFSPNGHQETRPVVGVAGIVYGDGRKGEDLWARLVAENGGRRDLRAIGQGWAGACKRIQYGEIPAYLRGLNVFLCCSRIEGVPYPPLEALACGVKVVIPRGVGLLDELPDVPGIHRFDAGDYDDMCRALTEALAARADQQALRAAVAPYTWDAWVDSHLEAFEEWL